MSRIRLRDTTVDDLETIYDYEQDEEAARRVNFPLRSRERFMAHWHKVLGDPATVNQTVLIDDVIAGNIGSWDQDGRRMIGYWFGGEFRGRGIGSAAVKAFVEAEVRPLYADPAAGNLGSVRLLEKCGFTRVGLEQVPAVWHDGKVEHLVFRLD